MPRFFHWVAFCTVLGVSASSMALEGNLVLPKTDAEGKAIIEKAEAGNAEAQYIIGMTYRLEARKNQEEGKDPSKSLETAVAWIQKAAEQGYALAENTLGMLYIAGIGVEQSDKTGVSWVRKAADKKDPVAQYNLAMIYLGGVGVTADENKAFEFAKKSAEQKQVDAQLLLGEMFMSGKGTKQDKAKALALFKEAAQTGNPEAMYRYGVAMGSDPTKRKDAVVWIEKAANANFSEAQVMMGLLAFEGDDSGKGRDLVAAYQWMLLSIKSTKDADLKTTVIDALADMKKEMTPEQIKQGQAKADTWKPTSYQQK